MTFDIAAIHRAVPDALAAARLLGLTIDKRQSRDTRAIVICPWHSESRPSCTLEKRDGRLLAHCKACGVGGDFLSLVAAKRGLTLRGRDFVEVCRYAGEMLGVAEEREESAEGEVKRKRYRPVPFGIDQIISLAELIDQRGEDWLAGRELRPIPSNYTAAQVDTALTLLVALDRAALDEPWEFPDPIADADEAFEKMSGRWARWNG